MRAVSLRRGMLVGLLSLASCGWLVGEAAEQKSRQDALDKVRYDDLDELWKEAVELWDEYDCELPDTPKADETFACEDKRRWLRVKSSSGEFRVELEEETTTREQNSDGEWVDKTERNRDWELEFKLLERLDPKQAAAIDAEAEAKGQKAKDATRDLIDAFE